MPLMNKCSVTHGIIFCGGQGCEGALSWGGGITRLMPPPTTHWFCDIGQMNALSSLHSRAYLDPEVSPELWCMQLSPSEGRHLQAVTHMYVKV